MNGAHVHLALNHLPVVLAPLAITLLLYGLIRHSREVRSVGLAFAAFAGAFVVVVFMTGEPAEHIVEHLPGISEESIEQHEQMATAAMSATVVAGVLALVAMIAARWRARPERRLVMATLMVAIVASALLARTAFLGGEIHHEEIRTESAAAVPE
jgi:uncharacterized membrane protein